MAAGDLQHLTNLIGFKIDFAPLKRLNQSMSDIRDTIKTTAVTASATAGSIFGLASAAASTASEIQTLAKQTGASTKEIQEFLYAAEAMGTPLDNASEGLRTFTEVVADAVGGGGAGKDVFKDLGIQLEEVTDQGKRIRPTIALFKDFSDALNKLEDPAKRFFYIKEVMQEDGAKLTNLLSEGSQGYRRLAYEAEQYNLVIKKDSLEQMRALNQEMSKLKAIGRGLLYQIGSELTPIFLEFIQTLDLTNTQVQKQIKEGIVAFFEFLAPLAKETAYLFKELVELFNDWITSVGGAENAAKLLIEAVKTFLAFKLVASLVHIASSLKETISGVSLFTKENIKLNKLLPSLSKNLTKMGAAASFANLAKLGKVGLIIAGITALSLAIQDLYTYLNGGDSIIGRFVEAAKAKLSELSDFPIISHFIDLLNELRLLAGTIAKIIGSQFSSAWDSIKEEFSELFSPIFKEFKDEWQIISNFFSDLLNKLHEIDKAILDMMPSIELPDLSMDGISDFIKNGLIRAKEAVKGLIPNGKCL